MRKQRDSHETESFVCTVVERGSRLSPDRRSVVELSLKRDHPRDDVEATMIADGLHWRTVSRQMYRRRADLIHRHVSWHFRYICASHTVSISSVINFKVSCVKQ